MFKEILFPVRKEQILYNNKPTGRSMIIREDEDEFISVVSDDYMLVPNKIVVDSLVKEFNQLIDFNKSAVKNNLFSNGSYSSMTFDLKYPTKAVKVGDEVGAVLRIENSYDTTKALTVSMNAKRLVCSNGLIVNRSLFTSRTKHIGDHDPQEVVNSMIASVKHEGHDKFEELNETFKKMSRKRLTKGIKEKFFKALVKHPAYVSDKVTAQIIEENPKNLWELYNCVTYVTTHQMNRQLHNTLKTEEELNRDIVNFIN